MANVDGIQFSSYCETCCAMGLLADDMQWIRCLQDAFASTFEPLTTEFATIIALCEPSSPVVLWEKNLPNFLKDFRRRYAAITEATKPLQTDQEAAQNAMGDVQEALKDISVRLKVEDFGLAKPIENLPTLPYPCPSPMNKSQEREERLRSP